jgi:hypothetical protein
VGARRRSSGACIVNTRALMVTTHELACRWRIRPSFERCYVRWRCSSARWASGNCGPSLREKCRLHARLRYRRQRKTCWRRRRQTPRGTGTAVSCSPTLMVPRAAQSTQLVGSTSASLFIDTFRHCSPGERRHVYPAESPQATTECRAHLVPDPSIYLPPKGLGLPTFGLPRRSADSLRRRQT